MKHTIKVKDIWAMAKPLTEIARVKLKPKAAYNLGKIKGKLEPEIMAIEEARVSMMQDYLNKDNDWKSEDKKKAFIKEFTEFLESQEDIELEFTQLDLDDLGDFEISADIMAPLEVIFKI